MIGKLPDQDQKDLFRPLLKEFINPQQALIQLSEKIDWQGLEKEFAPLYSNTGTPGIMPSSKGGFSIGIFVLWRMPIRLMSGLLILKQMFDLGDETVIPEWIRDPYFSRYIGTEKHISTGSSPAT